MSPEPKPAALLAARIAKSYPTLSAYSAATLAEELCRIERAQHRHAERCCNGEDGGYVKAGTERPRRVFSCVACLQPVHGSAAFGAGAGDRCIHYYSGKRCHGLLKATGTERAPLVHDPDAEARAAQRIETRLVRWENQLVALHDRGPINLLATTKGHAVPQVTLEGDPRGAVLKVQLPGESEARGV